MRSLHIERHRTDRIGWLRAAVRVTFWGMLAIALTAGVSALFGAVV